MLEKKGRNNKKIRLTVAFLCLGFLLLHFGITYLFTSPLKNHKREEIHYVVNGYMYPLFWQNWSLFVPAPKDDKRIFISFKESDDSYSELIDPLEKYYAVYQWLRYSPQGKVILGFDNTLWWVYNDLRNLNTPWNRPLEGMAAENFKKMNGHYFLKNLVLGTFKQHYDGTFLGAKVHFKVKDTETQETYFLIIDIE